MYLLKEDAVFKVCLRLEVGMGSRGTRYTKRINIHGECRGDSAFYCTHIIHLILGRADLIVTLLIYF